ncbi:hypothetical protein PsorP6_005975 [Peronosclerospora sorghi]|uniref:Uncharacterized protein n=1 Tax=Peronosclerospora sorghi TaxID=230839 RepID=A0ACC0W4V0_9STRA|nr:hypothetical protein PsorP6_005975 [Peronosclerospora sorghi]
MKSIHSIVMRRASPSSRVDLPEGSANCVARTTSRATRRRRPLHLHMSTNFRPRDSPGRQSRPRETRRSFRPQWATRSSSSVSSDGL